VVVALLSWVAGDKPFAYIGGTDDLTIRQTKATMARCSLRIINLAVCIFVGLLTGGKACLAEQSRAYEDYVPAGSLHLGQVIAIAKRDEVVKMKPLYEAVKTTGVDDADIVDGTVVAARIFCCGGLTKESSSEVRNSLFLYVPKGIEVGMGDIVELRVGHIAQGGSAALMNSVTRVVQKSGKDEVACWWDPKNDRLWQRVLYCDWMPKEGWIKQEGMGPAWYKPPSSEAQGK
jgi:hypothetical protein